MALPTKQGEAIDQKITVLDTYDRSFLRQGQMWFEIDGKIFSLDLDTSSLLEYAADSLIHCKTLSQSEMKLLHRESGVLRSDEFLILNGDGKTIARVDGWNILGQNLVAIRPLKGYEDETLAVLKPSKGLKAIGMTQRVITNWLIQSDNLSFPGHPLRFFMAPTTPIRKSLVDISQNFFQVARFYELGIVEDIDPECLHQYRVFVRKIRSYLSLMGSFLPPAELAFLKEAFREFQQRTNRLRDLDVHVMDMALDQGETGGDPKKTGVFTKVQNERQSAYKQACAWFSSQQYADLAGRVEHVFEQSYKWPLMGQASMSCLKAARIILDKIHGKIVQATMSIHSQTKESDIHRVRILYKKLRYLMEFFGPIEDRNKTRLIKKKLKVIQEELGRFNDLDVQINFFKQDPDISEAVLNDSFRKKELAKESVLSHLDDFLQPDVGDAFDRLFQYGEKS